MANSVLGNKIYIDSAGVATANSGIKVAYIVFTPAAAGDRLELSETSGGDTALVLQGATAKQTTVLDLSRRPAVFTNGVYVKTISHGASATLITTKSGD